MNELATVPPNHDRSPNNEQHTRQLFLLPQDYFMSEMNVPALTVVGVEGLFGCIALFAAILPIAQVPHLQQNFTHVRLFEE